MNESIIETEVTKILTQTSSMRTTELVRKIRDNHSNEMGFSEPTIYRRISELKKQKKILKIGSSECNIYGIKNSDKNAKYLILQEFDGRKQHIDEILKFLEKGDDADILAVFEDLDLYTPRYPLIPDQLDKIVPVLTRNLDIAYRALKILHTHMRRSRVAPINKKKLLENIKQILKKMDSNYPENLNAKEYCLEILGLLNDHYVVEQLKKDAQNLEKLKKVKIYYESPYVAGIIEKELSSLFDIRRSLRKSQPNPVITNNNQAIAEIIKDIQSRAANFVMYPPTDAEFYAPLELTE